MKEPWFWRDEGLVARAVAAAMAPAALFYDGAQRLRAALSRPASAGAPVICVGNATLGGVGKTPFALLLHSLLKTSGVDAHFVSRGHGGALRGPARVGPQHTDEEVGDEPLLLAAAAPTWIAKSRLEGVRAAAGAGAEAIIMDDGFQNPTIRKDAAILLIDVADPGGNGRVFPAGPLREPIARAAARADAVVLVGAGSPSPDLEGRPLFRVAADSNPTIAPQRVIAFCGIGRPTRFFESLEKKGFSLAARIAFPDHHRYRPAEISALRAKAKKEGAALIATEKDMARLAPEAREGIATAKLSMTLDDPDRLTRLILTKIGRAP